jgi:hypothetical protein
VFGPAGPYEKLSGQIFFAVDRALLANRIVNDLSNQTESVSASSPASQLRSRERPYRDPARLLYGHGMSQLRQTQ